MKTLFINRHAKSSWENLNVRDFERPLNKRGISDAPEMGRRLKDRREDIELFISSPALRAKTTARIIAEVLEYPEENIRYNEDIYEANIKDILEVIAKVENSFQRVILFGHNPTFTHLIEYLSGEAIGNLPTCGIAKIEFPQAETWKEVSGQTGNLKYLDYPKKETN